MVGDTAGEKQPDFCNLYTEWQEKEWGETGDKKGSLVSGLLFLLVIFTKKNGTLKDEPAGVWFGAC